MKKRPSILIIEDNEYTLICAKAWFEKLCDVSTARSPLEAELVLAEYGNSIDIFLIDICLGLESGIKLANSYKARYPNATICLWTSGIQTVYRDLNDGIECIQKSGQEKLMVPPVMAFWLSKNQQPEIQERQTRIMQQLPHKGIVEMESRKPSEGGVEAIEMRLIRDTVLHFMAVAYRHPAHPNQIDACLSLGHGCRGGCRMCLVGRINENVTSFTAAEIVAQLPHILGSYKAYGYLTGEYKLSIGYSCGNDPIYCWKELCQAIKIIDDIQELEARHIITTIGNLQMFNEILPKFIDDGNDAEVYLSGHATQKVARNWLLPATTRQSLEKTAERLSKYASDTGRKWTYSHLLIKDFNDSMEEAERIASLLDGMPCCVKVMTMADGCLTTFPKKVTAQDGLNFTEVLKQLGVDVRYRKNVGEGTVVCGMHLSTHNSHVARNLNTSFPQGDE